MKELDLLDALGKVEQKYIDEVVIDELRRRDDTSRSAKSPKRRSFKLSGVISAAACAVVAIGTVFCIKNIAVGRADLDGFVIRNGMLIAYTGNSESVKIPDAVTSIADGAFASNKNAGNIKSLTLSASLTDLEAADLDGLTGLESLDRGKSDAFVTRDGATISNCGEVLLRGSDRTLTDYSIPDGVLYIAPCAFTAYDLENVDFGDTVEYIGFNAFASTPLVSVDLPDSVKEIAPGAFSWCVRATEGHIPDSAKYYDDSFEYVPFFVKKTTGENPPSADIAGGIMPSEAIKLSDTDAFAEKVNAMLKKLRDSRIDETGSYLVYLDGFQLTVSNERIDKLPESVKFSDLSFTDSGWGGNGLYDIRADLPCDGFTLCLEAYAYAPYEQTSWKDVDFRIGNVYFVDDSPADSYDIGGGWTATIDRSAGQSLVQVILQNTDGRRIATFERVDAQGELGFCMSPGGKYVAIEYQRDKGEEKYFFMQSLCGNVFEGFDYMYYVNKYYGKFAGGLKWLDGETLSGRNEFGTFTWKMSEMTPTQDISEIPEGTKEITCQSERGNYNVTMTVPASWLDRGYFSDMAREKDKKDSTTRMLRNNGMYTDGLISASGEWDTKALDGTGWTSVTSAFTYGKTDQGLGYLQITSYYPDSYDKYTQYLLVFRKGNKIVFTMEFTSYGDDPEGYYSEVLLPVIESVVIEEEAAR